MTTPENPADLFHQGWKNYRLILEHDYLWHRMAEEALVRTLEDRARGHENLRFLDLACGDAETTSRVLTRIAMARRTSNHPWIDYLGVDSSPMALAQAALTRFGTGIQVAFVEADFVEFLRTEDFRFEAIYVGMSAHHLGLERLPDFFAAVKARLAPGGLFVAYEPFCLPDETRDEHIDRLHEIVRKFWIRMPPDSRRNVIAHTAECDFPVTLEAWNAAAASGNLKPGHFVAHSPDRLYAMVVHEG